MIKIYNKKRNIEKITGASKISGVGGKKDMKWVFGKKLDRASGG